MSETMKDGSISASAVVFPKEADFAVPLVGIWDSHNKYVPTTARTRMAMQMLIVPAVCQPTPPRTLASQHSPSRAGKRMMRLWCRPRLWVERNLDCNARGVFDVVRSKLVSMTPVKDAQALSWT